MRSGSPSAAMQDQLDIARLRALLGGDLGTFAPPDGADPRVTAMARQQMEAQAAEHQAKIDGIDRQIAQKTAEAGEVQAAIEQAASHSSAHQHAARHA